MTLIRSSIFNAAIISWTFVLYLLFLPTLIFPPNVFLACLHFWIRGLFCMQSGLLGLSFRFLGTEHLPEGPMILAPSHQSAWDTIAFYALFRQPAYVVKKELALVPGFSRYARVAGVIILDRSGGPGSVRGMLRQAANVLGRGGQVVIFPEGTRSLPGSDIRIHSGVSVLYRRNSVPVIPVSLNSGLYWGRRSYIKRPGTILVQFGDPIEPGLSANAFETLLAERINEGNRRLLAETGMSVSATSGERKRGCELGSR